MREAEEPPRAHRGHFLELALERGGGAGVGRAYLAVPSSGRGRCVLVLAGEAGLDALARQACERLARSGFVALAPELNAASDAHAVLAAAEARLFDDPASDGAGVGVLGFGSGGARAIAYAARSARVATAIDFYGTPTEEDVRAFVERGLPGPLLLFGGEDARRDESAWRDRIAALPGANLRVLSGAGDDFMVPARADRYAAEAAAEGWDLTLAWLGRWL